MQRATGKIEPAAVGTGRAGAEFPARAAALAVDTPLTVTVVAEMAPLEHQWRLLERDTLSSLHQSYDWCAAWVATYHPQLAILRGRFGDQTAFILPLEIVRSHGTRTARFIGAPRSNINTGLFSAAVPAEDPAFATELKTAIIAALRGHADLLLLSNMPLNWRGRVSPLAALPAIENQNRAFQLPLLASFEETLSQVNAKRRRKKFRSQTKLLDAMGGYDHVVAATPAEKRQMLDLFLRQKTERFRAAGLPDVFQGAEIRQFLLRLLDTDSPEPGTVALELHAIRLKGRHEGHMPAIAALSRKGDHVICQFASIDESQVPEASPGELLFWLMIETSQRAGAALFDFGIGDQLYKRSWCPVETVQHDVLVPISALGKAAAFAQKGLTQAKMLIKGNPRLYGAIQKLRARRQQSTASDGT